MNWMSRRILLVLAMSLLVGLAHTAGTSACNKSLNPFIKNLVNGGVKLLKLPEKVPNKCGTEWKLHGTCCDTESLIEYANNEIASFKKATTKLQSEIANIVGSIGLAAIGGVGNLQIKIDNAPQDKKAELLALLKKAKDMLKKLIKIGDVSAPHLKVIKEDKVCVNKLSNLRTASFCNTCAVRSPRFFQDGKALMSMSTCKEVIGECHDYWFALISIIDELASIEDLIQEFKGKFENSDLAAKFETIGIEFLHKWLLSHKLKERFETCPSPSKCEEQSASAICSSLISIRKQSPIFGAVSSAIEKDKKLVQKKKKNNFEDRRLLNGDPFGFFGQVNVDISVVPTGMQLPANQTTMNFELQFP